MIGISKLYCGTVETSDPLRYGRRSKDLPSHLLQFSADKKPVIVWNMTRACNLACSHCYAQATPQAAQDELTLAEALRFIDDLADFGSPVILFSGGEPMMHPHLFTLIEAAKKKGLRAVLSTNGMLINEENAARFYDLGLSYVGISLDGLATVHDQFRRQPGAFEKTLNGLRTARKAGLKVGLRFTINTLNAPDLGRIFNLIEEENIPRACFYHLVPTGRGRELKDNVMPHQATRHILDLIMERTKKFHDNGRPVEILTVDNHADGPYLYLKLLKENPSRAQEVLELLELNGGNSSGLGIAAVSWNGDVHPDQFWRDIHLGNIRQKPFSQIWQDPQNELLQKLKNKKNYVKGRCQSCQFINICGGNLRVRGHRATGDIWGEDPACYLNDDEIYAQVK